MRTSQSRRNVLQRNPTGAEIGRPSTHVDCVHVRAWKWKMDAVSMKLRDDHDDDGRSHLSLMLIGRSLSPLLLRVTEIKVRFRSDSRADNSTVIFPANDPRRPGNGGQATHDGKTHV